MLTPDSDGNIALYVAWFCLSFSESTSCSYHVPSIALCGQGHIYCCFDMLLPLNVFFSAFGCSGLALFNTLRKSVVFARIHW